MVWCVVLQDVFFLMISGGFFGFLFAASAEHVFFFFVGVVVVVPSLRPRYPSTVATQSRRARDLIDAAFERSVTPELDWMRASRLHDFGFRACTGVEQSVLGGTAHLLNFSGTDTMSAAYYAQFELNGGVPVAESIPATEHSVMTSWPDEEAAINNMIDKFGAGVFACVMDSYDYRRALYEILPRIAERKKAQGGVMVLRPDSGDPVEAVLMGLDAAEKAFGAVENAKGYKVLNGCAVIQGDGINVATMARILDAAMDKGYAACNTAYGMGGGLLQKVNRDTMSFATKLSFIHAADGEERDVMKTPKTDSGKFSLPGELDVRRDKDGVPRVYPRGAPEAEAGEPMLRVVYDCGPVKDAFPDSFDQVRARVAKEWNALPKRGSPISAPLKAKIDKIISDRK
jgi:nicotinamide phosphoribosyltransferase